MKKISVRRFKDEDEAAVSDVIGTTLSVSNRKDYSSGFIEENIRSHSPQVIASRAKESHFYVAVDDKKIIGCGGITGYWGSTEESYLISVFVLPDYQGKGVGRKIIEALEADEYFLRVRRTEVGSSLTAVNFYRKMGYEYKNGVTTPDESGVVRLEKNESGQSIKSYRSESIYDKTPAVQVKCRCYSVVSDRVGFSKLTVLQYIRKAGCPFTT